MYIHKCVPVITIFNTEVLVDDFKAFSSKFMDITMLKLINLQEHLKITIKI